MCHRAVLRLVLTLTLMLTLAAAILPAAPAEAATTYKVTYYANGGTGAPSAQTKKKGVTLKLSSVRPTRATYTFKGWATSATAKSPTYKPGSSYTGNKALKLHAVWHLNYVALGDSYSSGEGAKPKEKEEQFIKDAAFNTRACHRSKYAYGKRLDSSLNLELKAFGACTGATTSDVSSPQKLKGKQIAKKQLDYVNSNIGLVTLTIGGNDIGFAKIIEDCITGEACTPDSTTVQDALKVIRKKSFAANLATTYATILTKAPKAKLLVIGYPPIGPGKDSTGRFGPMCAKSALSNPAAFYPLEIRDNVRRRISEGVHLMVSELNKAVSTARATVNGWYPGRVFYVSPTSGGNPFAKHHLCAKEPWVNDVVDATNSQGRRQYSYHPNHLGQGAYEQILRTYIKDRKWAK